MLTKILLATVVFASSFPVRAEVGSPTDVPAPVSKILRLNLFDDNDNVEVILAGFFPDSCHKVGGVGVAVDQERKSIKLSPRALKYHHASCLQMRTPFEQVVNLGVLRAGTYSVQLDTGSLTASFSVSGSRVTAPDDYLYAPVANAFIDRNGARENELVLKGTFPRLHAGCMVMEEVRVIYDADVVIVQPIAKIKDAADCARDTYKFDLRTRLTRPIEDYSLLHVRVMNGNSINNLLLDDDDGDNAYRQ